MHTTHPLPGLHFSIPSHGYFWLGSVSPALEGWVLAKASLLSLPLLLQILFDTLDSCTEPAHLQGNDEIKAICVVQLSILAI